MVSWSLFETGSSVWCFLAVSRRVVGVGVARGNKHASPQGVESAPVGRCVQVHSLLRREKHRRTSKFRPLFLGTKIMSFFRALNRVGDGALWTNNFPELKWDSKSLREKLRSEILQWEPRQRIRPGKMRVLVFGVTGQGKSSTINSWVSCLLNEIRHPAHSGTATSSVTLRVGTIHPLDNSKDCSFEFVDMPGFTNIEDQDLEDVIFGRIKIGTELIEVGKTDKQGKSGSVRHRNPDAINKNPKPFERPCVVVMTAKAGKQPDQATKKKIAIVHKAAGQGEVRTCLVLTHVDNLSGVSDVTKISYSKEVQEAMRTASNEMGLPMNRILPVMNFVKRRTVDLNMSICLLYALSEIMKNAQGETEKRIDGAAH